MNIPPNQILRGLVGSTAHGINIVGQDDRDETGIYIETAEQVCGMTPNDHYIWRTQPNGVRSGPGDLDLTMYSLRKFCRLAAAGNPSVMMLLWLPEFIEISPIGERLVAIRDAFISKQAGQKFLGYLIAQRQKMTGERSKEVSRPELVAKYGFDTKFAMHALRLGMEGIELMRDGMLTLPVAEPNLTVLRMMRTGGFSFDEALALIRKAEAELGELVDANTRVADFDRIDRFMVEAHMETWEA
jgi:predicted nucleotidyltransferase